MRSPRRSSSVWSAPMAKTNRAVIRGKGEEFRAWQKKLAGDTVTLPVSSESWDQKPPFSAAQIQGAVRVICLADPAGPGARVRQAISAFGALPFAACTEVD